MKTSIKLTLLASTIAALGFTPAAFARYHSHDDHRGGISFSIASGGYCDTAGCPDHFWRYPVHYGPVFVQGRWFLGPMYFRGDRNGHEYWVRGAWHRDEWRGYRPGWARQSHDGPPLSFDYYASHGFRLDDRWRHQFSDDNGQGDRHDHGGDDNRGDRGGDNHDHGGDNNRGGDWHPDHGGDRNGGPGADNGGQRDNVIRVTTATYGGATCRQPAGNVTHFVAAACDGKKTCDYVVQVQAIGDPAPGCGKDFAVQWTCSMGNGGSARAPAEAGLGSHVALQCGNSGR